MSKMEDYTELKSKYHDFFHLDEFSRICRIAKRSARYLVENGIVPATDTGKKTWRYKIATDDVINYLTHRDKAGSMIPPGAVSSRRKGGANGTDGRKTFLGLVAQGQEHKIAEYFKFIYAEYGEILTTANVAEITGLHKNTIQKLAKSGRIKWLERRPTYLIPKKYLLEFVTTRRFLESRSNSETFKKILGGYEIWRAK